MMMTVSKAGLAIQSHKPAKVLFREKPVGDNTILSILSIHVNQGSAHARGRDQTPGT